MGKVLCGSVALFVIFVVYFFFPVVSENELEKKAKKQQYRVFFPYSVVFNCSKAGMIIDERIVPKVLNL